jgi:hypothetical protein
MSTGKQLDLDRTLKLLGEGFKSGWPPLIEMDESTKARMRKILSEM